MGSSLKKHLLVSFSSSILFKETKDPGIDLHCSRTYFLPRTEPTIFRSGWNLMQNYANQLWQTKKLFLISQPNEFLWLFNLLLQITVKAASKAVTLPSPRCLFSQLHISVSEPYPVKDCFPVPSTQSCLLLHIRLSHLGRQHVLLTHFF